MSFTAALNSKHQNLPNLESQRGLLISVRMACFLPRTFLVYSLVAKHLIYQQSMVVDLPKGQIHGNQTYETDV